MARTPRRNGTSVTVQRLEFTAIVEEDQTMDHQPVSKADLTTALGNAVREIKEYVDERTRDLQTEVLRAFGSYNNATAIRMRKLEADVSNVDSATTKRLGELEETVTQLQIRVLQLESGGPKV